MKVTLTNTGATSVPVMSSRGGGWAEVLEPNTPTDFDREGSDVVIVGDKPDVREQLEVGLAVLAKTARAIADAWRTRSKPNIPKGEKDPPVSVTITNKGTQSVRVILGDGVTDTTVAPDDTYAAQAPGYVELRELGNAPQQGGTPD